MADLLPVQITLTPSGVAEAWLLHELGLTVGQVHELHSDVIGAPRHYQYRHGQYFYSADGVRALADHFGLQVDVTCRSTPPDKQPPYWWQKDAP